ncbi:hypothetical protein BV20DRAFT_1006208 [Pilatotrama ljubarskyi]|nr:hypothetical protein BV20DRAFT_1006208 [Pilatotrama ljubarskyi]
MTSLTRCCAERETFSRLPADASVQGGGPALGRTRQLHRDETAAVVALYQAEFTLQYIGIATTALLLYDVLLCFGAEIRLVWRDPYSFASVLYVLIRYPILVDDLLGLATLSPLSDKGCTIIGWASHVLALLTLPGPAVFAALRVYALSGRSKILSGITLVLSLSLFLTELSDVYHFPPINEPSPLNCSISGSYSFPIAIAVTLTGRVPAILAECLVLGITWRESYKTLRLLQATGKSDSPSLHQVLLQNGSVYFCALVSLNILDIIFFLLQLTVPDALAGSDYVLQFIDPISTILTSRFLLDLRATDEKMSRSAASLSMGSLHFAGADILSGQPQPFLSFAEDPQADAQLHDGGSEGTSEDVTEDKADGDNNSTPERVVESEIVELRRKDA